MTKAKREALQAVVDRLRALRRRWADGWLGREWQGGSVLADMDSVANQLEEVLERQCRHLRFTMQGPRKGTCAHCGAPIVKVNADWQVVG